MSPKEGAQLRSSHRAPSYWYALSPPPTTHTLPGPEASAALRSPGSRLPGMVEASAIRKECSPGAESVAGNCEKVARSKRDRRITRKEDLVTVMSFTPVRLPRRPQKRTAGCRFLITFAYGARHAVSARYHPGGPTGRIPDWSRQPTIRFPLSPFHYRSRSPAASGW